VAATRCRRPVTLTFDLLNLEVGVGVACDLGYPCAKFRLPRPFGFRDRADVRDIRQTDRQTDGQTDDGRLSPLNPPAPLRGGGIISVLRRSVMTSSRSQSVERPLRINAALQLLEGRIA